MARESNSKKVSQSWRCIYPTSRRKSKKLHKSFFGFPLVRSQSRRSDEKETLKDRNATPISEIAHLDTKNKEPGPEGKVDEVKLPDLHIVYPAEQKPVPPRFSSLVAKKPRARSTISSTTGGGSQYPPYYEHLASLTLSYLDLETQTQLPIVDGQTPTDTTGTSPPLPLQGATATNRRSLYIPPPSSPATPPEMKAMRDPLLISASEEAQRKQLLKTWNSSYQAFHQPTSGRRRSDASLVSEFNVEEVVKSMAQSRGTLADVSGSTSSGEGSPSTVLTTAEGAETTKENLAIAVPPLGKSRFHMSEVKFPGPPTQPPNGKNVTVANNGNIAVHTTTNSSLLDNSTRLSVPSAGPVSSPPKRSSSFAPPGFYRAFHTDTNGDPSQVAHELLLKRRFERTLPPPPPLPPFFPPLPEPKTYSSTEVRSKESEI